MIATPEVLISDLLKTPSRSRNVAALGDRFPKWSKSATLKIQTKRPFGPTELITERHDVTSKVGWDATLRRWISRSAVHDVSKEFSGPVQDTGPMTKGQRVTSYKT